MRFDRLWAATCTPTTAAGFSLAKLLGDDCVDDKNRENEGADEALAEKVPGTCTRTYAVWQHEHAACTAPFDLFPLDFAIAPPTRVGTAPGGVDVGRVREGGANAVILWIEYQMPDGTWPAALSTGPRVSQTSGEERPTPWAQGVHFLPEPLREPGLFSVHASLDPLSGELDIGLRRGVSS